MGYIKVLIEKVKENCSKISHNRIVYKNKNTKLQADRMIKNDRN